MTLDLGPNDASYLEGFTPEAEIEDGVATHWTSTHAGVRLPLQASGPATLAFRYARVLPETAVVDVSAAGRAVERFTCRGGRFEERRVPLGTLEATPLDARFDVDSHDRRGLGLKLDWLRFEIGGGGRVRLGPRPAWLAVLLEAWLLALLRFAGFGRRAAFLASLPLAFALGAGALFAPFVLAHLLGKLALATAACGSAAALLLRSRPGGRWALCVFLAAYVVKGAGVFHPAFFYPDVRLFQRYVLALDEAQGGLAERGVTAQRETNTAYPRQVAGKAYAFPYSPLFFVPFTWLPKGPALVQDAQRHVGLLAGASEVLLVFALAGLVFGRAAGVGAALASALLPVGYSRLLYAMWPTLTGHVFDVLAITAALLALSRPAEARSLLRATLASLAALGLYVSSLINLGAFFASLALLTRGRAWRLLAGYVLAALVVVAALYQPFLRALFGEILPAVLGGARMGAADGAASGGLLPALQRIPMFYGWGWPALAIAGFVLLRRQAGEAARQALTACALAFVLLVLLRAFGAGLFRDLKEITFVAPLVALLAGAALEELWRRGRAGRLASALIVAGLATFCAERYWFYWSTYRSTAVLP